MTVFRSIEVLAGVKPDTDDTNQATKHYVYADKIRFVDGRPEKLGGWLSFEYDTNEAFIGTPRNIFSFVLDNLKYYLLASNTSLYSLITDQKTNITPVQTSAANLANPFSSYYATLGSNPIATTNNSNQIVITDTAHKFIAGDDISISGASAFNGIAAATLNTTHNISSVTTNTYTINLPEIATATGSGGGASVVRSSKIVSVTHATNGYTEGDNIEISGTSATVGGIPTAELNTHFQIRNVTTNAYDIVVATTFATSSQTGVGGASVDIYPQIARGNADSELGSGYGMGLYGAGLYGVPKTATAPTPPRVWSFDRFGDLVILTAGSQTGLYSWDGVTTTLPDLVSGAPTAINYCFTTDNIAVTLGSGGVGNRIKWSDQGNLTTWTATAENQAGEDDIEGAGEFISHAPLKGFNLLFTENQVWTFRYIRKPFIFETKLLDNTRGLMAQNARISVDGVAYWMGKENWYMYSGGSVDVIPSNSDKESTIKNYVFDNINMNQSAKAFCWFNRKFNEIWWHYPTAESNECDAIARFNIKDLTWTPDTMERTAAEYPAIIGDYPYLIDETGIPYQHEYGFNDDGGDMRFEIKTPYFTNGKNLTEILGLIPDSIQTGEDFIQLFVNKKKYPQSTDVDTKQYLIYPDTEKITPRIQSRYYQYWIRGEAEDQFWRAGDWQEELQEGTKR